MVKVGINGFGRIGRCALRIAVKNPEVEVVAVNARSGIDTYAHLLKYDTLHGTFDEDVRVDGDVMIVGDRRIKFTRFTEPKEIPWGELGVDVVLETTGKFKNREQVQPHLDNGAKKVLIAAPAKGEDLTIVLGVMMICTIQRNTISFPMLPARQTAWLLSLKSFWTTSGLKRAS